MMPCSATVAGLSMPPRRCRCVQSTARPPKPQTFAGRSNWFGAPRPDKASALTKGSSMIFKRAVARLRAQDWIAISVEIGIVIIGVFIGTQVSNLNNARIERAKTQQMARDLQPELRNLARDLRIMI